MHIRIEMDRGAGWELRSEGDADATVDHVREQLDAYAIQYPHRAWVDGELVATATPGCALLQGAKSR
jgi:hypothetical protein